MKAGTRLLDGTMGSSVPGQCLTRCVFADWHEWTYAHAGQPPLPAMSCLGPWHRKGFVEIFSGELLDCREGTLLPRKPNLSLSSRLHSTHTLCTSSQAQSHRPGHLRGAGILAAHARPVSSASLRASRRQLRPLPTVWRGLAWGAPTRAHSLQCAHHLAVGVFVTSHGPFCVWSCKPDTAIPTKWKTANSRTTTAFFQNSLIKKR